MYFEMPRKLKEDWVAALRSGEYKQIPGSLCGPADGEVGTEMGYCCLGVLEKVAGVEIDSTTYAEGTTIYENLPFVDTLEAIGIRLLYSDGYDDERDLRVGSGSLAELNDGKPEAKLYSAKKGEYVVNKEVPPLTFAEIADIIEREVPVYDADSSQGS